jgi:hypothetical protein
MGQQDAPTPGFTEGELAGSEINAGNGRRYAFAGHWLGSTRIVYRVAVEDDRGEMRGELSGELECTASSGPAAAQVEAHVRAAIRDALGYRP